MSNEIARIDECVIRTSAYKSKSITISGAFGDDLILGFNEIGTITSLIPSVLLPEHVCVYAVIISCITFGQAFKPLLDDSSIANFDAKYGNITKRDLSLMHSIMQAGDSLVFFAYTCIWDVYRITMPYPHDANIEYKAELLPHKKLEQINKFPTESDTQPGDTPVVPILRPRNGLRERLKGGVNVSECLLL
jgi:hypothetical protein